MLGLHGLIKQELRDQGKLPIKYEKIPTEPVTDSCFIYVDAINNTGNGHSNSATSWKNLMGGTNGTRQRYSSSYSYPTWSSNACVFNGYNGFTFGKYPTATTSSFTAEVVFKFDSAGAYNMVLGNPENGGAVLAEYRDGTASYAPNKFSFGAYGESDYTRLNLDPELGSMSYAVLRIKDGFLKVVLRQGSKILEHETSFSTMYGATKVPLAIGCNPGVNGLVSSFCSPCSLKVYSARVHTKALTDEEIYQNLLYERNRYNF